MSLADWSPYSGLPDDRLLGLFSALPPSRSANRTAFDDKFNFYSRCITQLLTATHLASEMKNPSNPSTANVGDGLTRFSLRWDQSFYRRFQNNGLLPKCLPQILVEMERRNQLVFLDSLLQPLMAPAPTTVLSQLFRTLWSSVVRPATGYLHHLVFVEDDHGAPHQSHHGPPEGWYVLMDRVKEVSQQWLEYYKQQHSIFYTDSILSVAELKSQLESMPANTAGGRRLWLDQDIDILIGYLHSTGSVMIRHPSPNETSRERMIIKVLVGRARCSTASAASISQTDIGIATLKQTSQRLHTQNQKFERKIDELHRQIKEALGRKNRSVAQRLLAHQKMLAKQLENRLAQLLTLDGILIRLQQTESEADVVKSFRVGAETLQQWMRDNGMTVDRVEETVQQVENVFEDYDEVEQAIESHTMPALSSLEDAELEAELDALLLAEQQVASPSSYSSIGQKQLIESLPSVPATLELQQQQTDASAMARKNEALLE